MARFQCYRTADGGVWWRLLGGNNRVLGQAVRAHPDRVPALREIHAVRAAAQDAWVEVEHAENSQWLWRLCDERGPLVHSGRTFARRIDAEHAAARFQVSAVHAPVDAVVAVFSPGRRNGRPSRPR